MEVVRFGTELQSAFRELAHRYAPHLQIAATLTLKTYAKIKVHRYENDSNERHEFLKKLNDDTISSTARRFEARLTHYLYGNQAKHKHKQHWARPLLLITIEGRNTHKRPHFHIAVGNIPEDKLARIDEFIKQAWHDCDFGNKEVCIKPLSNSFGWLDYMTKEVGYTDDDAFDVEHTYIPEIITNSICTESRLQLD
jgi:hypothetical protein